MDLTKEQLQKVSLENYLRTVGSPMYQAPELVCIDPQKTAKYTVEFHEDPRLIFKQDVWAAGISLYIMAFLQRI